MVRGSCVVLFLLLFFSFFFVFEYFNQVFYSQNEDKKAKMPYKCLELLAQTKAGILRTEQCQIRKYYGRTYKYRHPLPITHWKMNSRGKDHFVISLISGILRFPCLFASGNYIHFTTAN